MNLEQIAQQAMSYLDSVGVAADYEVYGRMIKIKTHNSEHSFVTHSLHEFKLMDLRDEMLLSLVKQYSLKSPD